MQYKIITVEEAVQKWLNGEVIEYRELRSPVSYSMPRGWEPIYPDEGGLFHRSYQYRIKTSPSTIFINGDEITAPLSIEEVNEGDSYWFVELDDVRRAVWCNSDTDFRRCLQKRCYSTEIDAERCRRALVRAALGGDPGVPRSFPEPVWRFHPPTDIPANAVFRHHL